MSATLIDDSNAPRIASDIYTFGDSLAQILLRQQAQDEHRHVIDALDFSIIAGFLDLGAKRSSVPATDVPIGMDLDFVGHETIRLLSVYPELMPGFRVLTVPTVYELANALVIKSHQMDTGARLLRHDDNFYDAVMRIFNDEDDLIDDKRLYSRVREFVETLPTTGQTTRVRSFLNLMEKGPITGLGQHFEPADYYKVKDEFKTLKSRLFNYLIEHRRPKEWQSVELFNFNNHVDAINFAGCHVFSKVKSDTTLSLAAPFPHYLRSKEFDKVVQDNRLFPTTLFLELKSIEIADAYSDNKQRILKEAREWCLSFCDRLSDCRNYIRSSGNIANLSDAKKREIHYLYVDYVGATMRKGSTGENVREDVRQARELFTSRRAIVDHIEKAGAELDAAGKAAISIKPVIESDELLVDYGLMDDPRVKAIRAKYQLG